MRILAIIIIFLLLAPIAHAQLVYTGTDVPYIHPRTEWLTSPELRNLFTWYPYHPKEEEQIPDYYPIRQIILHDTGCNPSQKGCNDESVPTPTILQNIFRFHAVTRGWGDIGYHFIIDRKGEIWEGKYGGNGVRGAHLYYQKMCQNFNVGSVGITLLGNYANTPMPPIMVESLKRLIGWIGAVNDLDVTSSQTIAVWTNPRNEAGTCVNTSGGFTTNFTGPVVLTHRDIESTNSDVQNIDMQAVRMGGQAFAQTFKTYVFQEVGGNTFYEIVQAKLKNITNTTKKIVTVIKTQLDHLRPELFALKPEPKIADSTPGQKTFPDGTLLKAVDREEVYLIKDHARIHISSASLFNGLGLSWSAIQEESEDVVNALLLEEPIVFPNGILLQAQTPDVYYITNSKRYLISSPELFNAYEFKWDDIVQITLNELDRYYPWGGYVKWPDGTVLQNQFNKEQVVVVSGSSLTPLSQDILPHAPIQLVNGRELASYESANVATPTLKLALTQVFDSLKQTLGVSARAQETSHTDSTNLSPSNTETASHTTDLVIPPEPLPSVPPTTEPIIKIALCKTRNTGGDVTKCAFSASDSLEIIEGQDGISTVNGFEDRPGFNTTLNDNQFRGKVYTVDAGNETLWLVNELPLEDYLKGIAETLGTDDPEYRKMLIIVARSYAYNYITQDKKYPDTPFHLTNSAFDQLYRGYNYEKRSNGLPNIVEDTRGKMVAFQGKIIVGAYSSDSGGVTKNPCPAIFPKYCDETGNLKSEFAYLKGGIADPEGTVHDPAKVRASHGVGISTVGARKFIEEGKLAEQIIAYYYPGIDMVKIY